MPQYASGHGAGINQEQLFLGSLGATHREPTGVDLAPIYDIDDPGPGPQTAGAIPPQRGRSLAMNPTWQRKFAELLRKPSVPGSVVPSRCASLEKGEPSAPGSQAAFRPPSRQPSRQSSVECVHDAFVGGASAHSSNQVPDADRGRRAVELSLPEVLKHEVQVHQPI
jgi:hypothetical protein